MKVKLGVRVRVCVDLLAGGHLLSKFSLTSTINGLPWCN